MINDLKAMAIFAEVIKQGSFRAAGKSLSLSPSVVSYHITQLESKLGAALIYRSTRKLTLSHDGKQFYDQVLKMLSAANSGMDLLSSNQDEPSGSVKISLPTALSCSPLIEKFAKFSMEYPKVKVDILFSDTKHNIIEERIDLTVRAGDMQDSSLIAKKIGSIERVLVCSPEFYEQYSFPSEPEGLVKYRWIGLKQLKNNRTFIQDGKKFLCTFTPQITVNSVEAIYQLCLQGSGLAVLANWQVRDDLKAGRLIQILPNWQVEPLSLHAVWPRNLHQGSIAKKLLNYIV